MNKLITKLQKRLPNISFKSSDSFHWSPKQQQIRYVESSLTDETGAWALIHEAAHASLGHQKYQNDYQLLMMEVEAWEQAQIIAKEIGVVIDPDHIQDCLDTYRDWLHERSTCPTCGSTSLQSDSSTYACHNCHTNWHVSTSRFCRPYRLRNYKKRTLKA